MTPRRKPDLGTDVARAERARKPPKRAGREQLDLLGDLGTPPNRPPPVPEVVEAARIRPQRPLPYYQCCALTTRAVDGERCVCAQITDCPEHGRKHWGSHE